jgi:hypothetical protein
MVSFLLLSQETFLNQLSILLILTLTKVNIFWHLMCAKHCRCVILINTVVIQRGRHCCYSRFIDEKMGYRSKWFDKRYIASKWQSINEAWLKDRMLRPFCLKIYTSSCICHWPRHSLGSHINPYLFFLSSLSSF